MDSLDVGKVIQHIGDFFFEGVTFGGAGILRRKEDEGLAVLHGVVKAVEIEFRAAGAMPEVTKGAENGEAFPLKEIRELNHLRHVFARIGEEDVAGKRSHVESVFEAFGLGFDLTHVSKIVIAFEVAFDEALQGKSHLRFKRRNRETNDFFRDGGRNLPGFVELTERLQVLLMNQSIKGRQIVFIQQGADITSGPDDRVFARIGAMGLLPQDSPPIGQKLLLLGFEKLFHFLRFVFYRIGRPAITAGQYPIFLDEVFAATGASSAFHKLRE